MSYGFICYLLLSCAKCISSPFSARLKNIEETEKAKRAAAEEKKDKRRHGGDEFLAATRCT